MVSHSLTMTESIDLQANWLALLAAIISETSPDRVLDIMGIRRAKVYRRGKHKDPHTIRMTPTVIMMRRQGKPLRVIAETTGVAQSVCWQICDEAGLSKRSKG